MEIAHDWRWITNVSINCGHKNKYLYLMPPIEPRQYYASKVEYLISSSYMVNI